jgi:hypothetical protein
LVDLLSQTVIAVIDVSGVVGASTLSSSVKT